MWFFKFLKQEDQVKLVVWLPVVLMTIPPMFIFIWGWVGLIWSLMLIKKLCMKLVPAWRVRPSSSLKWMWVFPATFLVMLPWYIHSFNATREASTNVMRQVEQYHETHGAYPVDLKILGYDGIYFDIERDSTRVSSLGRLRYYYDIGQKKPCALYHSPFVLIDDHCPYYYNFERKIWGNCPPRPCH